MKDLEVQVQETEVYANECIITTSTGTRTRTHFKWSEGTDNKNVVVTDSVFKETGDQDKTGKVVLQRLRIVRHNKPAEEKPKQATEEKVSTADKAAAAMEENMERDNDAASVTANFPWTPRDALEAVNHFADWFDAKDEQEPPNNRL